MKLLMTAAMFLLLCGASVQADYLLSDNERPGWESNTFERGEPRLRTGATVTLITAGEFASSPEFVKTASRPDDACRALIDGRRGPEGDCQAFGHWGGGVYYGSFIIDLQDTYLITRAAIWSQQAETRGVESFELLLSTDGERYISVGAAPCPADLRNRQENLAEKIEYTLEKPTAGRYVQFRVKKHPARMQMILAEAAVWGDRLPAGADETAYLPENRRPEVALTGKGIGSGALKLDWSGFASASQVKTYRVYRSKHLFAAITDDGVECIGEFPAKQTSLPVYPLTPGERGCYGVTAVYEEGEYPAVQPFLYTAPGPVDCAVFGDMLAINHFWGGGSARHTPRKREWETVAMDLLGETPFREIRWWESYPEIVRMFYERGIGVTTFSGERNYGNGQALGIHLYGAANEPHLRGVQGADFARRTAEINTAVKQANPANMLYAPTVCLDGRSLDFLEEFYAAGAKEHFDVLDVHNYLGNTTEFVYPPGYPSGSPEGLFERIGKVKAVMEKYGDGDKPMISTEFGYTECNVANPVGAMDPERKAAFLVRGLIIQHVLGFRRVYVYSFWDEGADPNYTEHFFGLLDHDLQKKPAFHASVVLGRELGECVYENTMPGADEVNYGYVYRNPANGRYITVVWNGSEERAGTFRTAPGTVTVTSMTGEKKFVRTADNGTFRAVYGPAPLYLESSAPVQLQTHAAVPGTASSERVMMILDAPVVVTGPTNEPPGIGVTLVNPATDRREVRVALETPQSESLAVQTLSLSSGKDQKIMFPIPPASGRILDRYEISLQYEGRYESHSEKQTVFVRRLAQQPGVSEATMHGYDQEVMILADEALEVSVDPVRGGRILEIYDRRTGQNQITIPYDRLGGLHNIAFQYCIWDEVKAPNGFGISRNAPYRAEKIPGGVRLTAANPAGLAIVKTLTLEGGGVMKLQVSLENTGSEAIACSWYMHPEYTVGGGAESHADFLTLPIGDAEVEIPYWSGLGERLTPDFTAGWWGLTGPSRQYRIRQDFDLESFRNPRLWFGIGCCNLEMESRRDLLLSPHESWTGELKWTFSVIK